MNAIAPRNETEALIHEKFQSLPDDLNTAGDNAQYGHVLDDMDDFLFTAIRKLAHKKHFTGTKTVFSVNVGGHNVLMRLIF